MNIKQLYDAESPRIGGNGSKVIFPRRRKKRKGGGISWNAYWTTRHSELATYQAGLLTPLSNDQIVRIGEFMEAVKVGLSIASLDEAFDAIWLLSGESPESSLKNLVKDDHHCTLGGTPNPTFTAFEGFVGDGAHGYINANFNPSIDGVKFTRDNAGFGIYLTANEVFSAYCGVTGAGGIYPLIIRPRATPTESNIQVNAYTRNDYVGAGDRTGLISCYRSSSSIGYGCLNKNRVSGASNSVGVANANAFLLAKSNNNVPEGFCTSPITLAFFSRYFTQIEHDAFFDAIETYMDAVGVGVVPP